MIGRPLTVFEQTRKGTKTFLTVVFVHDIDHNINVKKSPPDDGLGLITDCPASFAGLQQKNLQEHHSASVQ
jgi:hypothetical protein